MAMGMSKSVEQLHSLSDLGDRFYQQSAIGRGDDERGDMLEETRDWQVILE